MVHNFLAGGAAINAIAKVVGAELAMVDMGVDGDLSGIESSLFHPHSVAKSTGDISVRPAVNDGYYQPRNLAKSVTVE